MAAASACTTSTCAAEHRVWTQSNGGIVNMECPATRRRTSIRPSTRRHRLRCTVRPPRGRREVGRLHRRARRLHSMGERTVKDSSGCRGTRRRGARHRPARAAQATVLGYDAHDEREHDRRAVEGYNDARIAETLNVAEAGVSKPYRASEQRREHGDEPGRAVAQIFACPAGACRRSARTARGSRRASPWATGSTTARRRAATARSR